MKTVTPEKKLMTAEEFCDFVHRPENDFRFFELVRGEVIEMPPPKKRHGVVTARMHRLLANYACESRSYYTECNDAGVVLERGPDTVRGPDISLFAGEYEEDELDFYSKSPPLLAVEVQSPEDKKKQVAQKIQDYLNNSVQLVWVADPVKRTVTVYRLNREPVVLTEESEITGEDVFPGFCCKVADFFPPKKIAIKSRKDGKTKPRNGKNKT